MSIGLPSPSIVVDAEEPKVVIPALLEHLRACGQKGSINASWIEDVYSFILKDIEADTLSDQEWIEDLLEVLCKRINTVCSHSYYFGRRANKWGWWQR